MTASDPWQFGTAAWAPDEPEHRWLTREDRIEQAARAIAGIEPGEDWPSNEALGGHWALGTRDDEYRDGVTEEARAALDAVIPQVATEAELDDLLRTSTALVIVNDEGREWRMDDNHGFAEGWVRLGSKYRLVRASSRSLSVTGPWTVVHRQAKP